MMVPWMEMRLKPKGDELSEDVEAQDDSVLLNNAQVDQSDPGLNS